MTPSLTISFISVKPAMAAYRHLLRRVAHLKQWEDLVIRRTRLFRSCRDPFENSTTLALQASDFGSLVQNPAPAAKLPGKKVSLKYFIGCLEI